MEHVKTLIPAINAHVFRGIWVQIVMWLIIAITNFAHITVSVIPIIQITNVYAMAVILVQIARKLITATKRYVLIMERVITTIIYIIVNVIQDILEQNVKTLIVQKMGVRMEQRV